MAGMTYTQTQNPELTLLVSGSFLFSGLMFGPDLDIYSHQYQRWGWLRWIWLPYRRSMRHRGFLSHGPVVGTIVRVVYLLSWVGLLLAGVLMVSAIAYQATGESAQWQQLMQQYSTIAVNEMGRSLQDHWSGWLAIAIGLELGALSHSLSDWLSSAYKRRFKRPARKSTKAPRNLIKPSKSQAPSNAPTQVKLPPTSPRSRQQDSQLPLK